MTANLNAPLTLPCGLSLPNRLAKAAMTEGLADPMGRATPEHERLYRRWGGGGPGLQITGNVQIDRRHLEAPGNLVIDAETPGDREALAGLARMAEAAKAGGGRVIMQVSHAGRQTPATVNPEPSAPSAVKLSLPGNQFGAPREMTTDEAARLPESFARAARIARETGYDGVQLHGAHGYLLSQFLSPLSNRRTDRYGGSLENRARLLLDCLNAVKAEASADFAVSVKLNSADFQRGGFSHDDALQVARWIGARDADLLEISGGTYEQPRMMDMDGMDPPELPKAESTRQREAYFLDYAADIRSAFSGPLMVTGGFRTRGAMDAALASGELDVIGLARPFCAEPEIARALLSHSQARAPDVQRKLRIGPGPLGPDSPLKMVKLVNGFGAQSWYVRQLRRTARGEPVEAPGKILRAFRSVQREDKAKAEQLEAGSDAATAAPAPAEREAAPF